MPAEPTVSVVLPTYDRAGTLPRAIDSALAQDVDGLEVIVVDDGSTDDTPAVAEAYDGPAVRYVRQDDAGANAARNRGVEAARGAYVSFLDSDDELLPGHLPAVLDAIRSAPPGVRGAVTADARVADRATGRDGQAPRPAGHDGEEAGPAEWDGGAAGAAGDARVEKVNRPGGDGHRLGIDDVRDANVVGGFSSTTFERGVFDDVGPLDESMPAAQDYEFFLRYLRAFDLVCVDRVLVHSHVAADSISADPERKRRGNEALVERHGDVLTDRRRARQRVSEGVAAAKGGDLAAARGAFLGSLRVRPTAPAAYLYLATLAGPAGFERCYRLSYRLRAVYHRLTLGDASPRGG